MREAIGNTFIVNLLLVFIAVLSALLIGSIAYSKAYKVKNRIVFTIEKYGAWEIYDRNGGNNIVRNEIETALKDVGYHLRLVSSAKDCPDRAGKTGVGTRRRVYGGNVPNETTYDYCVWEYTLENGKGRYYGVTTFMHFNIPLIGSYLQFPVYGETRPLYDVGVYYNN